MRLRPPEELPEPDDDEGKAAWDIWDALGLPHTGTWSRPDGENEQLRCREHGLTADEH